MKLNPAQRMGSELARAPRFLDRRDPDFKELRQERLERARREYRAGHMTPFALRKVLAGCGLRPEEINDEVNALISRPKLQNGLELDSRHGRSR